MKHFTFLLGFIILFINTIYAINDKNLSNADKEIDNNDGEYLIYVNNPYGEFKIYSKQESQEALEFIESLIDKIHNLIVKNKNTFQHPEKLDEIENASQLKRQKRTNNVNSSDAFVSKSDFVYPISSIGDRVVLFAYLSKEIIKDIKSLDNVIDCSPNERSFSIYNYYSVDDILSETHWKNVIIREQAQIHLSLLSQGKYNKDHINQYDNNYYYPSSAGKDIDIVILDSSFHFNYPEFSNIEERIAQCAANVEEGIANNNENDIESSCGKTTFIHGEVVADMAGGLDHGTANQANIYGVSVPLFKKKYINQYDVLGGLQFIYEKMIRPHKTVVNLSLGGTHGKDEEIYKQMKLLIDAMIEKGGIVVAAAGNEGKDLDEISKINIPCEFENTICVGGFNNPYLKEVSYNVDPNSNYGSNVDVYAPYYVIGRISTNNKNNLLRLANGTSFSSPLVAGLIATMMSENPQIKYTSKMIKKLLNENGKTEIINYKNKNGSGILANNGKRIVYSVDNIYYG